METTFKAVDFAKHDVITRDLLDIIQANNQWLSENTPRTRQIGDDGSVVDDLGIIVSGRVRIPRSKKNANSVQTVSFGKAFHPTCYPAVTTGVVSENQRQIFCVVNGPEGRTLPNASGFDIRINVDEDAWVGTGKKRWKIAKEFFVYWQAAGYRPVGVHDV